MANELREKELPFKVKHTTRPRIIYRKDSSLDSPSTVGRTTKNQIELADEYRNDPYIVEHEIAHYQLRGTEPEEDSLYGVLEHEIKPDLIAYARIGEPKDYERSLYNMLTKGWKYLDYWEVTDDVALTKVINEMSKLLKDYQRWLPSTWKSSWESFRKTTEGKISDIQAGKLKIDEEAARTGSVSRKQVKRKVVARNRGRKVRRGNPPTMGGMRI